VRPSTKHKITAISGACKKPTAALIIGHPPVRLDKNIIVPRLVASEEEDQMEFETLATGYGLLEGPRTDEQNRLYFSDVRGGGVFRRSPDGRIETLIPERRSVGGIALNEGGGLLVTGTGLAYWNERSGGIRDIFTEWDGKPLFGLNDLT